MLSYLSIQDFALIKSLQLDLKPGFTALTGETGAGKSIILAAVELLLGQRAAADLIRQGAEAAVVEAQFSLAGEDPLWMRLRQEGLAPPEGDPEMVVRRVVSREGRNRVQINGHLSTVSFLAELGPLLLSICGQHSSQVLLRPEEHLLFLDAFAGLEGAHQELAGAVEKVRRMDKELEELSRALTQREQRREYLAHTVQELEAAGLDPQEEESLKKERRLLANAEKVAQLSDSALQGLYAAEEGSALETLGRVRGLLIDLAGLDEGAAALANRLEEAYFQLKEAAGDLQDYISRLVFDPRRQDWVESRLSEIQRLTRKHGGDAPAALAALAQAREELSTLERGEEKISQMQAERAQALEGALAKARTLSQARRQAAPRLAAAMEKELTQLGMASCRFKVEFAPPSGPALATAQGPLAARGLEQGEFSIAPNPGEGFRPLARIASGGELSRLLLALRSLVAKRQGAPTQIFDEVDAGIGGATASAIGGKLSALASESQVICITHLPQIAAWADHHLSVRKEVEKGRTAATVTTLDESGKLEELTRMLAGTETQTAASEHARQMLAAARKLKKAG